MSTPPTSLAEEFQDDSRGTIRWQRSSNAHSEKREEPRGNSEAGVVESLPAPGAVISTQVPHFNLLQRCSSLIFLSQAACTMETRHQRDFLPSFAQLDISFTLSRKFFVNSLQSAHQTSHLAIVNVTNPEQAGTEVGTFHRAILKRFRKNQSLRGRLIFLDRSVLPHLGTKELSAGKFKPYFGGCLLWNSGVDAAGELSLEVRDVWRWERVMEELYLHAN